MLDSFVTVLKSVGNGPFTMIRPVFTPLEASATSEAFIFISNLRSHVIEFTSNHLSKTFSKTPKGLVHRTLAENKSL